MAKNKSHILAALDIGSSKVSCFVARVTSNQELAVIGIGHHVSKGIKSGAIIDMEEAVQSISNAVSAAENMSGETIREVIVNITAGQPASQNIHVDIPLSGQEISDSDLRRILELGRSRPDMTDRALIHSIPTEYAIDGTSGIRDPRGMYGQQLSANIHLITAATSAVRNMANCISRCHLDISAAVLSSYASGLACLDEDEMELGVAVIDMGGGTTKLSVFNDGILVHTDIIPIGGQHVTSDIARGLGTAVLQAERLKTLHGHAMLMSMDDNEIIHVPQIGEDQYSQNGPISKSILVSIIQPRLEETFELIKARLAKSGFDKIVGRHIVLTGGGSLLPGMRELAGLVFNKQVRVGKPMKLSGLNPQDATASCSTLIGLLAYARQNKTLWGRAAPSIEKSGKLFSRFKTFFKKSA